MAHLAPIWHHLTRIRQRELVLQETPERVDLRILVVEPRGLEPLTPCLQSRCATNCAKAPDGRLATGADYSVEEGGVDGELMLSVASAQRACSCLPSSIFFLA